MLFAASMIKIDFKFSFNNTGIWRWVKGTHGEYGIRALKLLMNIRIQKIYIRRNNRVLRNLAIKTIFKVLIRYEISLSEPSL